MKYKVSDDQVSNYASRLLSGGPLGKLLPAKLSECDFTDAQREVIRKARASKRAKLKEAKLTVPTKVTTSTIKDPAASTTKATRPKFATKLQKLLYLQSNCCFFCGEALSEAEASIEHLNPISRGGTRVEENEVVCHSSLNQTFGAMDLKRKFAFVLRSAGKFACPKH